MCEEIQESERTFSSSILDHRYLFRSCRRGLHLVPLLWLYRLFPMQAGLCPSASFAFVFDLLRFILEE